MRSCVRTLFRPLYVARFRTCAVSHFALYKWPAPVLWPLGQYCGVDKSSSLHSLHLSSLATERNGCSVAEGWELD